MGGDKPQLSTESFGDYTLDSYTIDDTVNMDFTDIIKKIAEDDSVFYGVAFEGEVKNPISLGDGTYEGNYAGFYGDNYRNAKPVIVIDYVDSIDCSAAYDGSFMIASSYNDTDETIDITWDSYSESSYYEVYRRKDSTGYKYIGKTASTTFSDAVDTNAGFLEYRVLAVTDTASGEIIQKSNIESFEKSVETFLDEEENEVTVISFLPTTFDTDGDTLQDGYEIWDFTTLWNTEASGSTEENPIYVTDSDSDGLPDDYEVSYQGTNPAVANDFTLDSDSDGWSDMQEYLNGSDPWLKDSDFDNTWDPYDDLARKTDNYTRQSAAAGASVHVGLYDNTFTNTIDGVTTTYITNAYNGSIKEISLNYGNTSLNKEVKYFYDAKGNNTAIIESYDAAVDPTNTQLICITYTYDDNDNIIFICDQATKYKLYVDEDGNIKNFVIGDNSNTWTESQSVIDAKSHIAYKETNIVNNEGEDGDISHLDAGDLIRTDDSQTLYKNAQSLRDRVSTYKVNEEDTTSVAKDVLTYKNGNSNPIFVYELNGNGDLLTFADYSDLSHVKTYDYSYSDNGSSYVRNDGFTKTEIEVENETTQSLENGTTCNPENEEGQQSITNLTTFGYTDVESETASFIRSTITSASQEDETSLYGTYTSFNNNESYDSIGTSDGKNLYTSLESEEESHYIVKTEQEEISSTSVTYDVDLYTSSDKSFNYIYDLAGNITEIKLGNSTKYQYSYDPHGRITQEKDFTTHKVIRYAYNETGNIRAKKIYDMDNSGMPIASTEVTKLSSFGNALWPDQLTKYDGENITYDAIGNPLSYRDGMSFTWDRGRMLKRATFSDNTYVNYNYDDNGLRTIKTNPSTHTETLYDWDENALIRETVRNTQTNEKTDIWYLNDEMGRAIGFEYSYLDNANEKQTKSVYFEKNMQGDVIGLLDCDGYEFATYSYDAWGNITASTCDNDAEYQRAYNLNHITYRGYYRDEETEFYYLQSRYYDSEICRFLNADDIAYQGLSGTVWGYNQYIYCEGNPIEWQDYYGTLCLSGLWKKVKDYIRLSTHIGNIYAKSLGVDTTKYGAFVLCMKKDKNGIYHATFDCWQQYGGYNQFYDFVFDAGTYMKSGRIIYEYNGKKYALWFWKGDYINLGAGAELGIYKYMGGGIWAVDKSLARPMTLDLYRNGQNIIHYTQKHWWITGFNPKYTSYNLKKLSAQFTVDFSNNNEIFNSVVFSAIRQWKGKFIADKTKKQIHIWL